VRLVIEIQAIGNQLFQFDFRRTLKRPPARTSTFTPVAAFSAMFASLAAGSTTFATFAARSTSGTSAAGTLIALLSAVLGRTRRPVLTLGPASLRTRLLFPLGLRFRFGRFRRSRFGASWFRCRRRGLRFGWLFAWNVFDVLFDCVVHFDSPA
jgi:hypothetical protein